MGHIPIVSPDEYPADYFNCKGWHSVLLQGTVNHFGMFIDIYVGWLGRVHDARVLATQVYTISAMKDFYSQIGKSLLRMLIFLFCSLEILLTHSCHG